jgi:catechol 2,3-dioxygenase-like lactoylglutathione lyase family enzyme
MILEAIDHVQVAIPRRGEGAARIFYSDLLGLPERAKPDNLARRGGCWFEGGGVRVHCGVEEPFHPAHKAHIAFRVDDVAELAQRARARGFEVVEDEPLPGHDRVYIFDPFGNRLEFLTPHAVVREVRQASGENP